MNGGAEFEKEGWESVFYVSSFISDISSRGVDLCLLSVVSLICLCLSTFISMFILYSHSSSPYFTCSPTTLCLCVTCVNSSGDCLLYNMSPQHLWHTRDKKLLRLVNAFQSQDSDLYSQGFIFIVVSIISVSYNKRLSVVFWRSWDEMRWHFPREKTEKIYKHPTFFSRCTHTLGFYVQETGGAHCGTSATCTALTILLYLA